MADMEIESLDNIDGTDNIILKSSRDGTAVAIPKTWAILSGVLKTALETDPSANEASVDTSGATLVQVVKFLEHHQGVGSPPIEKPVKSTCMRDVAVDVWDADFIDGLTPCRQDLYDIILAANYLDIQPLLHLGCAKIAVLIKGAPVDRLSTILDPQYVEQ